MFETCQLVNSEEALTERSHGPKKNCRGRIIVGNEIGSVSEHCHEPKPENVEEKLLRAELENRAVLTEGQHRSVILAAQRFVKVKS